MKKQLVIIGIVALIVCVGLSGCTNNPLDTEKNRLVGTWNGTILDFGQNEVTIVLFSDNTFSIGVLAGTWAIKDGKLVLTMTGVSTAQLVYSYVLSNDDRTLTITDINGAYSAVLSKQ